MGDHRRDDWEGCLIPVCHRRDGWVSYLVRAWYPVGSRPPQYRPILGDSVRVVCSAGQD